MRTHAEISDPSGLKPGDHVFWTFDGLEDFNRFAIPFFEQGIKNRQQLLYVTENPHWTQLAELKDAEMLIGCGALQLASVSEVYGIDGRFDPKNQLDVFSAALVRAKRDGYMGIAVAADNTALVRGAPDSILRWMRWEYMADRFMSQNPVMGLCGFNKREISPSLLDDLVSLHPVISACYPNPSFRIFHDGEALCLVGSLDGLSAEQFRRLLRIAPASKKLSLDLSSTDFVNHTALMVLKEIAASGMSITVKNADPMIRKIRDIIHIEDPNLHIEYTVK